MNGQLVLMPCICFWSWLGARAARDDSTWLMSLSCIRQEQKFVTTSCMNDMRAMNADAWQDANMCIHNIYII